MARLRSSITVQKVETQCPYCENITEDLFDYSTNKDRVERGLVKKYLCKSCEGLFYVEYELKIKANIFRRIKVGT